MDIGAHLGDKRLESGPFLEVLKQVIAPDDFLKNNLNNEESQELIDTVKNWTLQEREKNKKYDLDKRRDLYSVIKNRREDNNTVVVSRVLYACSFNDSNKSKGDQIGEILNDWVRQTSSDYNKNISGFLMIKGHYYIHFIESESQILNMLLKSLYEEHISKGNPYDTINVLAFNEDNPQRLFKKWGQYKLTLSGQVVTESDKTEQQLSDRVLEIYEKFMQAGNFLQQKYSKEIKISQTIWKEVSEQIILNNEDFFILNHPNFMSIKEYYEMYLDDIEIELDSELHFPQNQNMIDVLEYNDKNQPVKEQNEQQEAQDNDY